VKVVDVDERAEAELDSTIDWYEERQEGVGKRFARDVERRIELLPELKLRPLKGYQDCGAKFVDVGGPWPYRIIVVERPALIQEDLGFGRSSSPLSSYVSLTDAELGAAGDVLADASVAARSAAAHPAPLNANGGAVVSKHAGVADGAGVQDVAGVARHEGAGLRADVAGGDDEFVGGHGAGVAVEAGAVTVETGDGIARELAETTPAAGLVDADGGVGAAFAVAVGGAGAFLAEGLNALEEEAAGVVAGEGVFVAGGAAA
jgi:hypothetical protein